MLGICLLTLWIYELLNLIRHNISSGPIEDPPLECSPKVLPDSYHVFVEQLLATLWQFVLLKGY